MLLDRRRLIMLRFYCAAINTKNWRGAALRDANKGFVADQAILYLRSRRSFVRFERKVGKDGHVEHTCHEVWEA